MFSARIVSLWRSTSLRWSVVLTLVLWFLTLTVAIGVAERTQRLVLDRPSGAVDKLEARLLAALDAERFDHPDLWAETYLGVIEVLPELVDEPFLVALRRYQSRLKARIAASAGRRLAELEARQWLLGEPVALAVGEEPVDRYIALIEAEFPTSLHEPLLASLEQRREYWPEQQRWLSLPASERVRLIMEQLLEEAEVQEAAWCLALGEPGGDLVLQNVEFEEELASDMPGYRVFQVRREDRPRGPVAYCWAKVVPLDDGSEALVGVDVSDAFGALLKVRDELGGGFLFSFVLCMLVGGFLGYRIHRRLRMLNEAIDDVRASGFAARIPARADGDDFERLGSNINAMLDRLQALMAGVRAVSDNIAHDLKTPLTRLRHQIEFLAQQDTPSAEGVARVAEEADRLLETLTALLRIAQLEQGGLLQHSTRFDLGRLAQDAGELYEPVFTDAGQRLEVQVPATPVWVTGDRQLWNQALSNLLENALTHASSGAAVWIQLEAAGAGPVLEVVDSGAGLPEHEFERVFDRFYRSDRARAKPGTGLGLSLVRAIAEAHGARIELENRGGLVVRLRWPAATH